VPTGVLVDRYGPRRLLVAAALVMGLAQLVFALVPSYPVALIARGVLGCGDALTWISVLRFAANHFTARRYPLVVALTAMAGSVGNIAATLPLAVSLHRVGWPVTFGASAGLAIVVAVAVRTALPDRTPAPRPVGGLGEIRAAASSVLDRVRAAWRMPGTRLGCWVHFSCMSSATAFAVLWGGEYLVKVGGFSAAGAGAVLMYGVIVAAIVAPTGGWVIGRRPIVRVPLALGVSAVTVAGWLTASLAFGDTPPRAYIVTLFVVMIGLGGPVAMFAFALARDYNPPHTVGTASGVVNVGGFVSTVLIALGIGWVLSALGGSTPRTLRWAVLVAVAVQLFGAVQMMLWTRRVRAATLHLQERGEAVPVSVVRRRWDVRAEAGPAAGFRPASGPED
jgi:MFS family permease